jgi:cell filamentation protein
MSDPYFYPGTDVLANKQGIRDGRALEQFERMMTLQRSREGLPAVAISSAGYREIHWYLFQDIYEWAGRDRTVELAKEESRFCRPEFIAEELDKRFAAIRAENELKGLTRGQFAARSAEHISELNAIHPFREGNGRTQRAFLEVPAANAGHQVDLTRVAPDAWNEASMLGFMQANYEPMRQVIVVALVERSTEPEQTRPTRETAPGRSATDDAKSGVRSRPRGRGR